MTADVIRLPKVETTQPPIEHTITVRMSSAGTSFLANGKPLTQAQAATIVTSMAQIISSSCPADDPA